MELVNEMYPRLPEGSAPRPKGPSRQVLRFAAEVCLHALAPMIPHVCEELWAGLGHQGSIFEVPFPEHDDSILTTDTVKVVVQVNGKVRATIDIAAGSSQADAERIAVSHAAVAKWLEGRSPTKVVYIKDRLINLVVT
jgi:leucyl-tRNA synthetase